MLKRLVTIQEFVKVSSVLNPDNINLELDIDSALNNFNQLSKIDKQTIKLQQYLDQAGKQIDSFSNGQIYNMWDYINQVIENGPNQNVSSIQIADYKNNIDTIKYVIIKWVEVFIYTHQVFVDANVEAPSNLPFNIEGKSDNANIESTRLDLINILNTTFFFEKVYVTGSVEDSRFNPLTDFGQFSGLEIGNLDNPNYKFSNGYIVKDVPYLGLENQTRLNKLEPRVEQLEKTEQGLISRVDGIQDNLNETNRQVEKNTDDIEAIKGGSGVSLDSLDKRITANLEKITQNTNDINQNKNDISLIKTELTDTTARSKKTRSDLGGFYNQYLQKIEDLQAEITKNDQRITSIETGFNWKGEWSPTVTYSKNDQVLYNGITYTSEKDNNLGLTPSNNPDYWKPTSTEFTNAIKKAVDDLDAKLNPKIEQNQKDILTNKEDIQDLNTELETTNSNVSLIQTKLNETTSTANTNKTNISNLKNQVDNLTKELPNQFVTLNTEQTIEGFKTHNNEVDFVQGIKIGHTLDIKKKGVRLALPATTWIREGSSIGPIVDGDKVTTPKLALSYLQDNYGRAAEIQFNLETRALDFTYQDDLDHIKDSYVPKSYIDNEFKKLDNYVTLNTEQSIPATKIMNIIQVNSLLNIIDSGTLDLPKQTRHNDKNILVISQDSTTATLGDQLKFLYTNTPTNTYELVNKKYVDDAVNKAQGGAYLDKNTTSSQNVKGLVSFDAGINISGYRGVNTNDLAKYLLKTNPNTVDIISNGSTYTLGKITSGNLITDKWAITSFAQKGGTNTFSADNLFKGRFELQSVNSFANYNLPSSGWNNKAIPNCEWVNNNYQTKMWKYHYHYVGQLKDKCSLRRTDDGGNSKWYTVAFNNLVPSGFNYDNGQIDIHLNLNQWGGAEQTNVVMGWNRYAGDYSMLISQPYDDKNRYDSMVKYHWVVMDFWWN